MTSTTTTAMKPRLIISIAPAEAAAELEKLTALLNETSARRAAREAELRELVRDAGTADALENLDAISGDMVRLSTALDLESRALSGARARCRELAPVVADEIGRLSGRISSQLREALAIVQGRAEDALAHIFDADQLPVAVSRTKEFRRELAFQQAHVCSNFGLNYVIGETGEDVLANDVQPERILAAYRNAVELLSTVSVHLGEVRRA
jgi:hypothetical protein